MKIFDRESNVNFVDENNVFVGYSLESSCCEHADWFILSYPLKQFLHPDDVYEETYGELKLPEFYQLVKEEFKNVDVSGFVFDTEYFNCLKQDCDGGGIVIFRLVNKQTEESLFLHLYNSHNGYYAHGFEMKMGDKIIHDSSI